MTTTESRDLWPPWAFCKTTASLTWQTTKALLGTCKLIAPSGGSIVQCGTTAFFIFPFCNPGLDFCLLFFFKKRTVTST